MIADEKTAQDNEKIRNELSQAYKRLFVTDDGKKVLADLESFCSFRKTSISTEWNPYQTMYVEGERRVYLHIDSMIRRKENE